MATSRMLKLNCCILILAASLSLGAGHETIKLYIVYMGSLLDRSDYLSESHHLDILQSVATDNSEPHRSLYQSYRRSFNGFAAWLTDQEQEKLSNKEEVLSVFPSQILQFQTTRSWDFIGLNESILENSNASDMVIGVLDSGIWPESESFSDEGFGPVPKKWKGACNGGANFTCNRKIVGARVYGGIPSARDSVGHGTHTASTAAGNKVKGASFYNIAKGTARGGVPSSRIAVYRVCTYFGCQKADILAGFDDAIADGVDVITVSLGYLYPITSIFEDSIAIGSFHAMASNIVTVNAAGNNGPHGATIYNLAPWVVSVGASTTDRKIGDKVVLADERTLTGESINSFTLEGQPKYPLIYGKKFNSSCDDEMIKSCQLDCLDRNFLKGKILMCNDPGAKQYSYDLTGASGLITLSDNEPYITKLPGLALSRNKFDKLAKYAGTTEPRATILKSKGVKDESAPMAASFSSRGPNTFFPEVMKPDVAAPGVEILAAYPSNIPPIPDILDERRVKYSILSGTSMACPHAAGAIGYVKSLHPDWSPSALKSALMTTARPLNASMHPDREFAYGSGHIDPVKAADPGLVFDISKEDYTNLVCNTFDNATCHKIAGADCDCRKDKTPLADFNYPALTARINGTKNINLKFTRVVTNVGHPNSIYKAEVAADPNLKILVTPRALSFKELNEKRSFVVSVTGAFPKDSKMLSSMLVWGDETHVVRSPIIIYAADLVQSQ